VAVIHCDFHIIIIKGKKCLSTMSIQIYSDSCEPTRKHVRFTKRKEYNQTFY